MHGTSPESDGPGFAVMLGAFADLGERIDKVGPAVASNLSQAAKPVIRPLGYSMVATVTNPDVLILPYRPQSGRVWNIRKVGLYGSDGHTPVNPVPAQPAPVYGITGAAPAAGTVIVQTAALPAGSYLLYTFTDFGSTAPAGSDVDNVQLFIGAAQYGGQVITQATTQASAQNPWSPAIPITIPAGGAVVSLKVGPGGGTGSYRGALMAIPIASGLGTAIADVYAGSDEEAADFSGQFMSGALIPSIATFGKDRIRVKSGEQVYALVYNVAAGQQLTMVCEVEEYRVQDVEAMSI